MVRAAPRPTGLASTITSVGSLGSKYTTVVLSDGISFRFLNVV